MAVSNGQAANEDSFNQAFVSQTQDSQMLAIYTLAKSGLTQINHLQSQLLSILSFLGQAANGTTTAKPTFTSNVVGASGDDLHDRVDALTEAFKVATGHSHDGSEGKGGLIGLAGLVLVYAAGAVQDIATAIAFSSGRLVTTMHVQGDGGPVTLTGAGQIDGMANNSFLVLIGASDTNTLALTPEAGELRLNGVRTLALDTVLVLGKFDDVIYEVSYNGIGGL